VCNNSKTAVMYNKCKKLFPCSEHTNMNSDINTFTSPLPV